MKKLWLGLVLIPSLAGASGIYNPGSTGAGGGAGIVSPGTFTWTNSNGLAVSTINMTGAGTITGLTAGTTNSMAVNFEQLSNIANANILTNGNFDLWLAGTSFNAIAPSSGIIAVATQWNSSAPNFTITVVREATTVAPGSFYSMKVTFGNAVVGNGTHIYQTIPSYWQYAGSSVTFSIQENSSKSQTWHLAITDSSGSTSGSNCANTSSWTSCSVTRFIPTGITSLEADIYFDAPNVDFGTAYLDQGMMVKGNVAMPFVARPLQIDVGTIGPMQTVSNSGTTTTSNVYTSTNLTAAIVPPYTTSKIKISVAGTLQIGTASGANAFATVFRGSTNLAVGSNAAFCVSNDQSGTVNSKAPCAMTFLDSPGLNTSQTYTVKIRNDDNSTSTSWASPTDTVMLLEAVP